MNTTRRQALIATLASVLALGVAGPSAALSVEEAKAHVGRTLDELKALLKLPGAATSRARELRRIMESRANIPLIAKFSAGRSWREMNSDQQRRFTDAFAHYVSIAYSKRFDEYSGNPVIDVGRARDAGRKGILVETPIQVQGGAVAVEWLVSDRAGGTQIVDLVIEGISMAATQREEISGMVQRRGGDIEAVIATLAGAS